MKNAKKIIIWGTGFNSEHCVSCLNDDNCKIMAFVETYPEKTQFKGKSVINPQELAAIDYDYLFIASQYISEIEEELKKCQISMDSVIDWLDYRQHPEDYSEDSRMLISDDFLKTNLLCVQEGNFEADKEKYSRTYEQLMQKEVIYVYDLRMKDFKLSISRLIDILINKGVKENIGVLFIPDESNMDFIWYHNMLFQLECYCFILWEEMRPFYMRCKKQFKDKFVIEPQGRILRKPILCRMISASRYMNFGYYFEPSNLQKKIDKARKIHFCRLYSSRVGETIRRILWLKNLPDVDNDLIVLIPEDYGYTLTLGTNACLTELINREFCMIRDKNELWFWVKTIFQNFYKCEFHTDYDANNIFRVEGKIGVAVLDFTADEALYGEKLIKQKFNLTKSEYICICARDSKYTLTAFPSYSDSANDYRNYDFKMYEKVINDFADYGLQVVRMGQSMKPISNYNNCIDFPNVGYDEYLDMMLHRNCKFVLCDGTGSGFISFLFGRPMATLCAVYPIVDNPFLNFKVEDLIIFCKYRDLRDGRMLSLYEIINKNYEFIFEYNWNSEYFIKNELEIIQPTADEMFNLAEEMNSKLDGTWVEEPEDKQLMRIFNEFVNEFYRDKGIDLDLCAQPTIATTFLRANREELFAMR